MLRSSCHLVPGLLVLLIPSAGQCEVLVAKAEKTRPDWVSAPPDSRRGALFFVGRADQTPSIAAGKDAAIKDAAAQIASYIATRVSQKLIVRSERTETKIVDEIRAAASGNLTGAKQADLYWEQYRTGGFFRRSGYFSVWVLVSYPEAAVADERQRLKSETGVLHERVGGLCENVGSWIGQNAQGQSVRVSGLKEQVTNKRYSFSRIVETEMADCLVRAGVRVSNGKAPRLILTGSYYHGGARVILNTRLLRLADGESLHAAATAIPDDSIEPMWLQIEEAKDEPFFASLEQWQSEEHRAVGALSLDSEPRGAAVLVDGEFKAKTQADIFDIAVGAHSVVFDLDGYELASETVRVGPGDKVPVRAELVAKTGTLQLSSKPSKAQVQIDGKVRGETPLAAKLRVGAHDVTLTKKGFKTENLSVEIANRETTEQTVTLVEDDGALVVASDPAEAEVRVDGQQRPSGTTPLRLFPLPAGTHQVRVSKPGFSVWEGEVRVRANEPTTVTATMKKINSGMVTIRSEPASAKLYVDGVLQSDFRGFTLLPLREGGHRVELTLDGYKPWTKAVKVKAGQSRSLEARLSRVYYSADGQTLDSGKHTSRQALVRGLLFPGWGQFYADRNGKRALVTFFGVGALTAGGFLLHNQVKQADCLAASSQYGGCGRRTERPYASQAKVAWGLAVALHLLGANDARRTPTVSDWSLAPTERGVQVAWSRRF